MKTTSYKIKMTNYRKKINSEIASIIDKELSNRQYVLNDFLSMLFWKNGSKGYIEYDYREEMYNIIDNYEIKGPVDSQYITFDKDKALKLINKMRKNIGLPLLIKDVSGLSEDENGNK